MKRSPSQQKSERIGAYRLHPWSEFRRKLLEVDFRSPQEQAMQAALMARVDAPVRELALPQRHWLIAMLMLRDSVKTIDVAEVCPHCGEMLQLQLGLEDAVREAEPILRRGTTDARLRLPTGRDLEEATNAEGLVATCSTGPIDVAEAETIWQAADPLGRIELKGRCCQCGGNIEAIVDVAARWLESQRRVANELLEEVHTLAVHYHWSECDILELSERRRHKYIDMCEAERTSGAVEQYAYE
jgi:hypothetical protein